MGAENTPSVLPIGASAPDFCLPGTDGKVHCLKDHASAKILVVIFTCNHCPTAQLYETRIKQKGARKKWVAWKVNP
jgi:peroxiredoxin